MIPSTSNIGWIYYDDVILPITKAVLNDGAINLHVRVLAEPGETIRVDANSEMTAIGVDGSQITWVPRSHPYADWVTVESGDFLVLVQDVWINEADRTGST